MQPLRNAPLFIRILASTQSNTGIFPMEHHALGTRSRLATALLVASLVSLPTLLQAANTPVKRSLGARFSELHGQKIANGLRDVEVFVRLDQPSVAELNISSLRASGAFASSSEQRAQAARVSQQQATMSESLAAQGAKILSRQRVGANGLRVVVKPSQIETLRALPGVRSVGRVDGQPAAFESANGELYVALHDGTVLRSRDEGRSWQVRSRP